MKNCDVYVSGHLRKSFSLWLHSKPSRIIPVISLQCLFLFSCICMLLMQVHVLKLKHLLAQARLHLFYRAYLYQLIYLHWIQTGHTTKAHFALWTHRRCGSVLLWLQSIMLWCKQGKSYGKKTFFQVKTKIKFTIWRLIQSCLGQFLFWCVPVCLCCCEKLEGRNLHKIH